MNLVITPLVGLYTELLAANAVDCYQEHIPWQPHVRRVVIEDR